MISFLIKAIINLLDKLFSFSDPMRNITINPNDHPEEMAKKFKDSRQRETVIFYTAIGIVLLSAGILLGGIYTILERFLEKPLTEKIATTPPLQNPGDDTLKVDSLSTKQCNVQINHAQAVQDSLFMIENQGKSVPLYTNYMYNLAFIRTHNDQQFCNQIEKKINENFTIINQVKQL